MITVSDVTREFDNTMLIRRTVSGLAKKIGAKQHEIRSVLEANPDIFKKVRGCKGEMYEHII